MLTANLILLFQSKRLQYLKKNTCNNSCWLIKIHIILDLRQKTWKLKGYLLKIKKKIHHPFNLKYSESKKKAYFKSINVIEN